MEISRGRCESRLTNYSKCDYSIYKADWEHFVRPFMIAVLLISTTSEATAADDRRR